MSDNINLKYQNKKYLVSTINQKTMNPLLQVINKFVNEQNGWKGTYETMVFAIEDGEINWHPHIERIETEDKQEAIRNHNAMVKKYSQKDQN